MGWFSADEIVGVDNSSNHDMVQSISIALLALSALAYGIFKLCNAHHRQQSQQVAERAIRLANVLVVRIGKRGSTDDGISVVRGGTLLEEEFLTRMSTSCEIKFDENPYGVYFPGQNLSGSVELRLAEVTKVKGVALQINGTAEVKWSETTGAGKHRRTVHYSGRQDYMHSTTYLAGSREGNSIELLPGIHTYRFSCMLPPNLVTSVEAKHGHVRYTVKVVLERSWKIDQSYKVAFTVLRHVDLNLENYEVRLPMQMDKAKTFCCGPCQSAPMYISAQVPISGYVPGQTIVVKIEVNNESNKIMEEISTKVLQVVSFISQRPYTKIREIPTIIAEVRCAGIGKHSKASYEQHLQIPAMPPSSRSCQVLTINYYVEVEGKVPGPVINPKVRIPITMGTIPLSLNARPTFDSGINVTPIVEQPTTSTEPPATPFPPELPPPTYEEVVNADRTNIQDEGETNEIGWRDYTPRYVVYRFEDDPATAPSIHEEQQQQQSVELVQPVSAVEKKPVDD